MHVATIKLSKYLARKKSTPLSSFPMRGYALMSRDYGDHQPKTNYTPKVLDLFCGAGGLSLGFNSAGCEILGGIDNERWPVKTHHHNFPNSRLKLEPQNIQDINPSDLGVPPGSIDILIGGPPCQGFSSVGRGKIRSLGLEKDRDRKNLLYREFIRFLDYLQPTFFVIENVQGMQSFKTNSFFYQVLHELTKGIDGAGYSFSGGYDVRFRILCAADYGVPQSRNRLFIIGRRRDRSENRIVFPEPSKNASITLGEAISDLPFLEAPILIARAGCLVNNGINQHDEPKKYRAQPQNIYQALMRLRAGDTVLNHVCRGHNVKDLEIFELLKPGQKYLDIPSSLRRYREDIFKDKYRKLRDDKPSWTLTAHMQKDCLAFIHPSQVRSLSVRESARIQSFPDDFTFVGPMTKLFRMIGNAVPPLLAEQVALPIVEEIRRNYMSSASCSLSA
jgi:DNA (cytosine-5)-methyltransferase 1